MDILMTRYILEIKKDVRLFKLFGNGWYPNIDEYSRFIHKQEKNNENFSKTLKRYNLVKDNDIIFETVMSKDINSVSSYFNNKSITLKASYGTVYVDSDILDLDYSNFYISNGIYQNTLDICKKIISYSGSFAVGVCDNRDSIFYKENKEKLKDIELILKKRKAPYIVCKHNNHRDKSYILAYRGDAI